MWKIKIIALTILFTFTKPCTGQLVIDKYYSDSAGNLTYAPKSMIQLTGSGYLISGMTGAFPGISPYNYYFTQLNSSGDTVWHKSYDLGNYDVLQSTLVSTGNEILSVGFVQDPVNNAQGCAMKLDSQGETIWTRTYGGSGADYLISGCETANGNFIVVGQSQNTSSTISNLIVMRIKNLDGDTLWTKKYQFGNTTAVQVIRTLDNNFLILASSPAPPFSNQACGQLIKIDGSGNVLWREIYYIDNSAAFTPVTIKETASGDLLLFASEIDVQGTGTNDLAVMKLNSNGNIIWSKIYDTPDPIRLRHALVNSNQEMLLLANLSSGFGGFLVAAKLDSSGNLLWSKLYNLYSGGIAGVMTNNNITLTGAEANQYWLMKTDPAGSFPCGESNYALSESAVLGSNWSVTTNSTTSGWQVYTASFNQVPNSITSTGLCNFLSIPESLQSKSVQVFPNPASKEIKISFPEQKEVTHILIYNSMGKLVKKVNHFSSSEPVIGISDLSTGIYLIRAYNKQGHFDVLRFVKTDK